MRWIVLSLTLLIFSSVLVNAQNDFRPGYVILNDSDTLSGEVDYRGDLLMSKSCAFKDEVGEVNEYEPGDIIGYRFEEDGKFYVSKLFEGEMYFMEYLVNGELDIFYMRKGLSDRYFVEKDDLPLTELPYKEGFKIKEDNAHKHINDQESYFYQSTIHQGILNIYTQDAPDFIENIARLETPNHNGLIILAKDYHEVVCEDKECIVYEKKESFFGISLELHASYFNLTSGNDYIIKTGNQFQSGLVRGVIFHVWMPRTSEKLFFRTGLLQMDYGNAELVNFVYKIPIMMEYVYPKYRIRPRIAAGINLYNPYENTVSALLGFNILLTEKINITAQYELEALPIEEFPLIPNYNFGNSIGFGLIYRF